MNTMDCGVDLVPQRVERERQVLRGIFEEQLARIYTAEHELQVVLLRFARAATASSLIEILNSHERAIRDHVQRLEAIAGEMGWPLKRKTCKSIQILLFECEETIRTFRHTPAMDGALILAAQKIKRYEIAAYGGLAMQARQLGLEQVESSLTAALKAEQKAIKQLIRAAESLANERLALPT